MEHSTTPFTLVIVSVDVAVVVTVDVDVAVGVVRSQPRKLPSRNMLTASLSISTFSSQSLFSLMKPLGLHVNVVVPRSMRPRVASFSATFKKDLKLAQSREDVIR